MSRRLPPTALVLLALAVGVGAGAGEAGAQEAPDLRGLFDEGWILQDRAGDGHPDFVAARIVVPEGARAAETAAAANLAARLGLETYATDLDLVVRDGAGVGRGGGGLPVIVVGRAEALLAAAGIEVEEALADLAPGEGAVRRLAPSDALPSGGVWVAGSDDTGLLEAAEYLAARYPSVWDPEGTSYDELAGSIADHLEEGGVVEPDLTLERAVVAASRPGVARVAATLAVGDADEMERALGILGAEAAPDTADPADTAGVQTDTAEAQTTGAQTDTTDAQADTADAAPPGPGALVPPGLHRLDVLVRGPDAADELRRIYPERAWRASTPSSWQPRDVSDFTLSDLYTLGGIYRDTEQDLVPDRSEAHLSIHGADAPAGAANLALRIGLETAGLRLPVAKVAGEGEPDEDAGFPIFFGVGHFQIGRLLDEDRLGSPTGAPGEGFVELVPDALDDGHALVVGGSDPAGLEAAAELAARRLPYLHDTRGTQRKGSYRLADLETEVRRFFQVRSAAGQVALAMHKLEQWADRLDAGERPGVPPSDAPWPPGASQPAGDDAEGEDPAGPGPAGDDAPRSDAPPLEEIRLELAIDTVPEGLETHVAAFLQDRFPDASAAVELHPVAFGAGRPVFDESVELPWEVDEARDVLREVAERVGPGSEGRIEVRVSEPPEIRSALEAEIRDTLRARGVPEGAVEVRVLNAYKQGFSWLEDEMLPRLLEVDPARIEITYRHLLESDELPWSVVGSDTRWLQELFPVDEVLAGELGIPDSAVVFRATRQAGPIYRVRALDAAGEALLEDEFSPHYVVRPYFDLFPDYERVRVSTGWVSAHLNGEQVVDRRVPTDLEVFWDHWQGNVLPRVRDYLMDLQEGRVSPGNAPFFDELRIEARLSEPNHRIGIDEEVISSLESLHNDLYFNTLAFLEHLGRHYGVGGLSYPGRVLPHIDPTGAGQPGRARVRLTGKSRASPELVLWARAEGAEEGRWRYPISTLGVDAPKLRGIALRDGAPELDRLLFDVVARDSIDRYDEHRGRSSESAIDRTFLPAELFEGMIARVRELHEEGVLREALSFEGVGELAFRLRVEDEDDFLRTATVPRSASPSPTRNPVLAAEGWEHQGERMVQWETPIPPAESDSVMARLATFPEGTVYFVGRSFLGKDIFAADFRPPVEAELVSQAKLNALRPTLLLSGRQHANEVSSTSHILRLGELLATDPEYRELLQDVNVVLHPITNPDGAQLAWELQRTNPDFTNHPGYLGPLGVDATSGSGSDDPIYPESQVRPHLMATWLPDIYLNLHGYPSHEWVQHFSGYAAWVRGRTVTQRTWWAPRGWFVPGFSWIDDPDHPEIQEAQFAILDTIARAINEAPGVAEMNASQYGRYVKYGRQDVEGFREHLREGIPMYLSLRGREVSGSGPRNPRVNTFSATTEAPDETARGDWLELVAGAGLAHTSALARYLATGEYAIEADAEAFDGWVLRRRFREKPVLPPEDEVAEEAGGP